MILEIRSESKVSRSGSIEPAPIHPRMAKVFTSSVSKSIGRFVTGSETTAKQGAVVQVVGVVSEPVQAFPPELAESTSHSRSAGGPPAPSANERRFPSR